MKMLLFILLFVIPAISRAQTDTVAYQKKIAYCTVETTQFGRNYEAKIDDGTSKKFGGVDIKNSKGKDRDFHSRSDILDYMTQLGWTLVSSYGLPGQANAVGFVFERPVAVNK